MEGGCQIELLDSGDVSFTFDGNGYTITGLATSIEGNDVGMFGGLQGDNFVTIRNLGLVSNLADGGNNGGNIGGLVAQLGIRINITNSYTTGPANGRFSVGGLVGQQSRGNITASYAAGSANGNNNVGGLVGQQSGGSIIASYGFGSGGDPDGDPPVSSASLLTLMNAGTNAEGDFIWDDADSRTLGAWDFGDSNMAPRLLYGDYDGDGETYGCVSGASIVWTNCGSLIGGQ